MTTGGTYFERISANRFAPTKHVTGAWDTNQQHVSPLFGLLAHLVDNNAAIRRPNDQLSSMRITNEIYGVIPREAFDVHIEVIRPGRTIELIQATVTSNDRVVVESRFWRLAHYDTEAIQNKLLPPLPEVSTATPMPISQWWPGDYIASVDAYEVAAPETGRAIAWIKTDVDILPNEEISESAVIVGLIDTANGVAPPQPITDWSYPNVELTIHMHRPPRGRQLGVDTTVTVGPFGHGITSSVLYDKDGHFGYANQMLTVRPNN